MRLHQLRYPWKFRAVLVLLVACATASAHAQNYPIHPIRMLVGFPAGGGADIVARIVTPKLSDGLREQVIVDNRPGAGSTIASDLTAKAAPDGYTLLMVSSSHAINAGLPKKLGYDALGDFTGIALVAAAPLILVVHPSLPVRSVDELIALARRHPGRLNYASSGAGGTSHLAAELFKMLAKVELTHVPYKGAPQALADVISGEVQVLFPALPTALSQVKAGRVRAIAITSSRRSKVVPDIPTLAERGLPEYEATNWYGLLGPAGIPKSIVSRLNAVTVEVLANADVREAILRQGAEPIGSSAAEFERYLKAEIEKWKAVIKRAGIRAD